MCLGSVHKFYRFLKMNDATFDTVITLSHERPKALAGSMQNWKSFASLGSAPKVFAISILCGQELPGSKLCFLGIARPESTCSTCAHPAWSQGEGLRFVHVFPESPRIEGLCAHPDTPDLDDPARSLNLLGVGGRRLFELWLHSSPF